MPGKLLHQGFTQEKTANGVVTTITYYGTKNDMNSRFVSVGVPATSSEYGRLESVQKSQIGADLWALAYRYTTAGYSTGSATPSLPPSTVIGVKSYSLDCAMITSPLEQHVNSSFVSDYRWCWNHSLARRYNRGSEPSTRPSPPDWWSTLGAEGMIPIEDEENYRWFQSFSELPQDDTHVWITIKHPTMPGVTSYDEAGYTLTMTERQKTYAAAEAIAKAKANRIFTNTQVGSNFTGGNWKCDRATVNWDGEFWIVNLTFTYSERGWNTTLYQTYTGSI